MDARGADDIEHDGVGAGSLRRSALECVRVVDADTGPEQFGEGLLGEVGGGEAAGGAAAFQDSEGWGVADGGGNQRAGRDGPGGAGGSAALGVADRMQEQEVVAGLQAERGRERGLVGGRDMRAESAVGAGQGDVFGDEAGVDGAEEVHVARVGDEREGRRCGVGRRGQRGAQVGGGVLHQRVVELVVDEDALGAEQVELVVAAGVGVVRRAVAGGGAVDAGGDPEQVGECLAGERDGGEGGGVAAGREDTGNGDLGTAWGGQGCLGEERGRQQRRAEQKT